jgi:hypothetical protein
MPGADAPAASRASEKSTRVSHHRYSHHSGIPRANGFNGFLRVLPGDRAYCLRHPWEALASQEFDISVGISGPRDFAVRRLVARLSTWPRPPHPAPNARDDRETPLSEERGMAAT